MRSNRIEIWRFADAPEELQALYRGSQTPKWLALVPRTMASRELDELIGRSGSSLGSPSRHELPDGDVVYISPSKMNQIPEMLSPATVRRSR
jgi:hypothetical protein